MTPAEEKVLISRSKHDPAAFGKIYDNYFDQIFNYVLYRIGNVTIAEDLTAQTFFNALKSLWKFRFTGISIVAWLYRIASNEVNGYLRKRNKRSFTNLDAFPDGLPDGKSRPDQELEAAEETVNQHKTFLILNQCIQKMKPEEQTLITLRYFNKKTFAEIAAILGKREGTLRMRTKRALEKLKNQLQIQGVDNETLGRDFI